MVFAPLRCLLTAKQTCFVAGLAIAIIVFVTSSTRSVPMANTDAGQPPSSEELSEPLPLVALGAAGAVESETCVPICDRSPCAEPEVKFQDVSFCSYGRRQGQFLTDHNGVTLIKAVSPWRRLEAALSVSARQEATQKSKGWMLGLPGEEGLARCKACSHSSDAIVALRFAHSHIER